MSWCACRPGLIAELPNAREACPRAGATAHGRVAGQVNALGGHLPERPPARRFSFDADAGLVVGVDAGCSHLTAIAADLSGQRQRPTPSLNVIRTATCAAGPRRREQVRSLIAEAVTGGQRSRRDSVAWAYWLPSPMMAVRRATTLACSWLTSTSSTSWPTSGSLVRVENDALLAAVAEGTAGEAQGHAASSPFSAGVRMGGRRRH